MTQAGTTQDTAPRPLPRIEDPAIAASAALNAMMRLAGGATVDRQRAVLEELERRFGLDSRSAREVAVLGSWVAHQADTAQAAIRAWADGCRLAAMTIAVFADIDGHLPEEIVEVLAEASA